MHGAYLCSGKKVSLKKGMTSATKPAVSYWRIEGMAALVMPFGLAPSSSEVKWLHGSFIGKSGSVWLKPKGAVEPAPNSSSG